MFVGMRMSLRRHSLCHKILHFELKSTKRRFAMTENREWVFFLKVRGS
jgi:hypothetical protein